MAWQHRTSPNLNTRKSSQNPGFCCALRTTSNIRHQTANDQAISDTSPPLHDPSVTSTSLQPDSFQYSWDLDQHWKSQENAPKTIPAQTKQITFIITPEKYNKKIKVKVQMWQFLTMSSVTLPPRALSLGKEASAKQWYRYANVIPPKNNYASPRSRPPWSSDWPTQCVCCFYHQKTSIKQDIGDNTSHKQS
jgi:hypothetical protein